MRTDSHKLWSVIKYMSYKLHCFHLLFIAFLVVFTFQKSFALNETLIKKQMIQNYNYILNSQVACYGNFEEGRYICDKNLSGERRILGSWDSYIVPVAVKGSYPVRYVDSNMFVTAHTVFPLFSMQFQDEKQELKRKNAIDQAVKSINKFQRHGEFAFWPQIGPSLAGQVNRIGPLNLSPLLLSTQLNIVKSIQSAFKINLFPEKVRWMEAHLDMENKDLGMDALFNVPNDADDTALGIATNYYKYLEDPSSVKIQKYLDMAMVFSDYTDSFDSRVSRRYKTYDKKCLAIMNNQTTLSAQQNLYKNEEFLKKCSLDDPREYWRYSYNQKHSNAFLTWLYKEKDDIYANPENGVALPGQNSVDCNVVANVLYTLALTGQKNQSQMRNQYENSCRALSNIIIDDSGQLRKQMSPRDIEKKIVSSWRVCGLFYPAHMSFPYMLSKAVNEAGACQDLPLKDQKKFDLAMNVLVDDLIQEQDSSDQFKKSGQWYESIDNTRGLPTALGAVTLLNLKNKYQHRLHLSDEEIKIRTENAIQHVIALSENKTNSNYEIESSLEEGTFFGGGTVNEIAHWRSKPFATSVSLELMIKYFLSYLQKTSNTSKVFIQNSHDLQSGNFDIQERRKALSAHSVQNQVRKSYEDNSQKIDKLIPLKQKSFLVSKQMGANLTNQGPEAIIGIELTAGKILEGNQQEEFEQVAYYKVKLNMQSEMDLNTNQFRDYNVQIKFLGIHTKSTFIINDEIAYLPIQYVKENEILTQSIYLTYAEIEAPLVKIKNQMRLNVNLIGKLIGAAHRMQDKSFNSREKRVAANLAEFDVGLKTILNNWSAGLNFNFEIGAKKENSGSYHRSAAHNSRVKGNITYKISQKQKISLVAEKNIDGSDDIFDNNSVSLKYSYFLD